MHNLLAMIEENEEIQLGILDSGEYLNINEISDGLTGELYTDEGWIMRFSKERYDELI